MDSIQDEIIEEFSVFDDWLDKYDYLIGLSETLPAIAPEHRTERYLIEGCQSRVWVDAKLEDGRVYYAADSDAIITKGIIALLIRVLNGRTPQEILDTELYFIDAIGLIHGGLEPIEAVEMGIINKSFDNFERELISDIVMTRIPDTWKSGDVF